MHTGAAFFIAPTVPAATIAITLSFVAVAYWRSPGDDWRVGLDALLFYGTLTEIEGLIAFVCPGIPAYLALRRLNWNGAGAYTLTGAALMPALQFALSWMLFHGVSYPPVERIPTWQERWVNISPVLLTLGLWGGSAALIFWQLARPDLKPTSPAATC